MVERAELVEGRYGSGAGTEPEVGEQPGRPERAPEQAAGGSGGAPRSRSRRCAARSGRRRGSSGATEGGAARARAEGPRRSPPEAESPHLSHDDPELRSASTIAVSPAAKPPS